MNNNNEISIIQLFKVAFGNKKRLILITALIAIIGVLFFHFFYDPGKTEYVADFNYFVQGLDNGMYIDGSAFNFEEMVSYEALEKAKASDSSFSDIDIETMYNKNNISVEHVKDTENKTAEPVYLYYRISVKSKSFKNADQARAFIQYLAEAPIAKTIELSNADKYKCNLKVFDDCESFDLQLNYLSSQLNLLNGKYDSLIQYYGDITLTDMDTITDKKQAMDVYFMNNSLSYLRYEQEENGYVLNKGRNIENLRLKKMDLEKQFKYNEMELEKLEGSITSLMGTVGSGLQTAEIDSYNSRITELISTNVNITREMDIIDLQLKNVNNAANADFAKKIDEAKQVLDGYTNYYQQVELQVLLSESKAFYQKTSIIEANGGMGLIKGGIIAVILGGFLACCVNLIADWREIFKNPFEEDENENTAVKAAKAKNTK